MALVWQICLLYSVLLILQYTAAQQLEEKLRDLDMFIIEPNENENLAAADRADEEDLKGMSFWNNPTNWIIVTAVVSLCLLTAPLCVYLFCPNCHICGCKMVDVERTHN